MELGTPLSCFIETRLDDDDFATLLEKPADDDGALDEVWVPSRCLDVRDCTPVCVGKGTLQMQDVQHNNEKCARITLHWRGKEWAVCLVLSEAAPIVEKYTDWGMIHYVCSNGIDEVPQEMQASVSQVVLGAWRVSVSLVESRSACTVVFTFRTVVATVRDRLSRHTLTAACASRRLHPVPSFFNSHALTLRSDTGSSCFTIACTARVYLSVSVFMFFYSLKTVFHQTVFHQCHL